MNRPIPLILHVVATILLAIALVSALGDEVDVFEYGWVLAALLATSLAFTVERLER